MLKDKGLFLKAETQTALWLPWDTVGQLIGDKLEKLLQMTFHVRAEYRDADYWYCEFGMNYIDIFTQERLFMAIDAIEDERQEMMGCGGARDGSGLPVNSLGMEVSKKILLLALGVDNVCIISLSTDSGTVYIYTVSDITIYENTADLSLPVMDGKTFVLVTCYPFRYSGHAPGKCVVTARSIGRKQVIAALHLCDFACE